MLIFIDESGSFAITQNRHRLSCVAAVVIPETQMPRVFREFKRMSRQWQRRGEEIKGKNLNEYRIGQVVDLLKKSEALVFAGCIDMGLHPAATLMAFRDGQAALIKETSEKLIHATPRERMAENAELFKNLSLPLFAQVTVLTDVIGAVIADASLYYVQRIPKTLGQFTWTLDAKEGAVTPAELIWSRMVAPFLQTRSLKEPASFLPGADYSSMEKFLIKKDTPPDHLRPYMDEPDKPFNAINVYKLLTERIRFKKSHKSTGLQLADIVANAIRRACHGDLKAAGWADIGKAMVQRKSGEHTLRLIAFGPHDMTIKVPYAHVVKHFDKVCRKMMTPSFHADNRP